MNKGEFYEDDEPIEDILAILARPADGVTANPRQGTTLYLAPSEDGQWVASEPHSWSNAKVLTQR